MQFAELMPSSRCDVRGKQELGSTIIKWTNQVRSPNFETSASADQIAVNTGAIFDEVLLFLNLFNCQNLSARQLLLSSGPFCKQARNSRIFFKV